MQLCDFEATKSLSERPGGILFAGDKTFTIPNRGLTTTKVYKMLTNVLAPPICSEWSSRIWPSSERDLDHFKWFRLLVLI